MKKGFKSIQHLLICVIVGVALMSSLAVTCFSIAGTVKSNNQSVEDYRQQLVSDMQYQLKTQVETALSLIGEIYESEQAGLLSTEEARKMAADYIRDLRYDDGDGYFWIDTTEGVNVVLLGRDTEGKSRIDSVDPNGVYYIQEIVNNGMKEGGGFSYFSFAKPNETEPLPKMSYSAMFKPYNWVVGTGVWIDSIDELANKYAAGAHANLMKSIGVSVMVVALLLIFLIIFAVIMGKRIAYPIRIVTRKIHDMADGDLSDKDSDSLEKLTVRADEIGSMCEGMLNLSNSLRELMGKIIDTTSFVASASEELTASMQQSTEASELVAQSITNVAASCSEQSAAVDIATDGTNEFSDKMVIFSSAIEETGNRIAVTNESAIRGQEDIKNAVARMNVIEESVSDTAKVVKELGQQVENIGSIADTISGIATQTNLLSLNASIEAARAGEAGRGFAVVADEIRQLADQSNMAAGKITELINSIQNKSGEAVNAMESGLQNVKDGTEVVINAGSSFEEIVGLVSGVAEQSKKMEQLLSELNSGTKSILGSIGKIDTMSKDVTGETENVSAASEEQSASMHEISTAAEKLASSALELQNSVEHFKLS